MNDMERMAGQIVLLQRQIRVLTERVEHPPRLPEYFVTMARAIKEVEDIAAGIGVMPECAWRPGPRRGEIMRALRKAGWSLNRIARTLDVGTNAVFKATRGNGKGRD